jgi:hypothetical protein
MRVALLSDHLERGAVHARKGLRRPFSDIVEYQGGRTSIVSIGRSRRNVGAGMFHEANLLCGNLELSRDAPAHPESIP